MNLELQYSGSLAFAFSAKITVTHTHVHVHAKSYTIHVQLSYRNLNMSLIFLQGAFGTLKPDQVQVCVFIHGVALSAFFVLYWDGRSNEIFARSSFFRFTLEGL